MSHWPVKFGVQAALPWSTATRERSRLEYSSGGAGAGRPCTHNPKARARSSDGACQASTVVAAACQRFQVWRSITWLAWRTAPSHRAWVRRSGTVPAGSPGQCWPMSFSGWAW